MCVFTIGVSEAINRANRRAVAPDLKAVLGGGNGSVIVGVFREIFSWWNGQTLGTRVNTWRTGRHVGDDEQGNRYYQSKDGRRRWVVYKGEVEASKVPASWHGWLHHTYDEPPTQAPLPTKPWEKPHSPNMTGTSEAYRPKGSLTRDGARAKATGDYEAWSPKG